MSLYLGLDVGTQGTKGLVVDVERGEVVGRASAPYGLIEGLGSGAAEQHPDTWIDAVREVARALFVRGGQGGQPGLDPGRVAGIGVSGQQHGLVVLDGEDRVVRPAKLWCDTSTAAEARELSASLGRLVPTGFTASKVLWLLRHEPENWARVRSVLLPHDYVNFRLTGKKSMEAGDASGTGFFDAEARDFRAADVRAIDARLPACLPPRVTRPRERAGELHAAGAELLGLPAGLPVAAGGGDNMMSAIGAGATRPGVVAVSLGTSGTAFTWCDAPVEDPEGLIAPFCASIGGWLPLLCIMNLTGVTEEVRAAFGADHETLTREAADVPRGCDGLLWLPYLNGERVPDLPNATGTLTGIRPGLLHRGHLYRAALEGTSLNLAWGVDRMRTLGLPVEAVNLVGGAARNELWRTILADTLGCPVTPLRETESAALGAALQAAWTVEREADLEELVAPFLQSDGDPVEPTPEGIADYSVVAERFRALVGKLYSG